MLVFGAISNNVISGKSLIYLFIFIVVQLIVLISMFEILRKPWEGSEIELEKVLELQQNKILDDSVSSMTLSENRKKQKDSTEN